jgi:DNA-binding transcriptional LysR family regulator
MTTLLDLEVRHLMALDAVAAEGTFGRAATRLGYTQSAVSQQIAALERMIGAPLFDRPGGPRPVTLTPLGEVVLGHARDLVGRVDALADDIERFVAGDLGRVDVGIFQSVSTSLLPAIVGRLRSEHPTVEIRVVQFDMMDDMYARLVSGELDVGFTIGDIGTGLDSAVLLHDPFVLVALPGDVPPGRMPIVELDGRAMIGEPPGTCQDHIDRWLRREGINPDYVFRTNDNGAVLAMVRAGMGVAVMPLLAVDIQDPTIAVRPLDPPVPERRIQLSWPSGRTRSPLAIRLVEVAQDLCAELGPRDLDAAACA